VTTSSRKLDHIRICLEKHIESSHDYRPFEDITLVHKAMPEIDEEKIDTGCRFLGRRMAAPLIINAITGGHPQVRDININLAAAAQEMGVGLGVGSQRAALEDPDQEDTFSAVRDAAPDIPIIGNIGAVQLKRQGPEVIDRLAEMIDADAIAVHLNFLQEIIQPEGDRDAAGALGAIRSAASGKTPIIVKETGTGISGEVALMLMNAGIRIIDVSGTGGTSFSAVEAYRAEEHGDCQSHEMGRLFWDWGVPTPVCIVECAAAVEAAAATGAGAGGTEIIASGGVRSGLDVARSIALGARLAGTALPMLSPATQGQDEVAKALKDFIRGLRISMFLTGCRTLSDLGSSRVIITGRVREILEQRGFNTKKFSIYSEMAR